MIHRLPILRNYSTTSSDSIIQKSFNNLRLLLLNKPKQLNALTTEMVSNLDSHLIQPHFTVLSSTDSKAFCAGGDIKSVVLDRLDGRLNDAREFFAKEYRLNHFIATVDYPLMVVMDGITMGGGVGLSVHAPFRISTEKTLFAMPETKIGLFPDVGGSFFLSRMDGALGTFLGLTGYRLKGKDVWMTGIATHHVPSTRIPALIQRLSHLSDPNLVQINQAIEEFVEPSSLEEWNDGILKHRPIIDKCFSKKTLEEIISALEQEQDEFAKETLATLKTLSPTACKVTLEAIHRGQSLDILKCFEQEFTMVQSFLDFDKIDDLKRGVTTVLIDKSKEPTQWSTTWENLNKITSEYIRSNFFPSNNEFKSRNLQKVSFHNDKTYIEYPHRFITGLPSEEDVKKIIGGYFFNAPEYSLTRQEIISWFETNWGKFPNFQGGKIGNNGLPFYNIGMSMSPVILGDGEIASLGKIGVKEKVEWILNNFALEENGVMVWKKSKE